MEITMKIKKEILLLFIAFFLINMMNKKGNDLSIEIIEHEKERDQEAAVREARKEGIEKFNLWYREGGKRYRKYTPVNNKNYELFNFTHSGLEYKGMIRNSRKRMLIEKGIPSYVYSIGLSQKEPIVVNKQLMPDVYDPEDYPKYNPRLLFHQNLSIGERERIKKSIVMIKIGLHTDKFKEILNWVFKVYGPKHMVKVFIGNNKSEGPFYKGGESKIEDFDYVYKSVADFKNFIFVGKMDLNSEQTLASASAINMQFYHDSLQLSFYNTLLPNVFYHESIHLMGLGHKKNLFWIPQDDESGDYVIDGVYEIDEILRHIFDELDFPHIPYSCYEGIGEIWNEC